MWLWSCHNYVFASPEETDYRSLGLKGDLDYSHNDGSEEADVIQLELGLGRPYIM